jgi:monoamine oxidase
LALSGGRISDVERELDVAIVGAGAAGIAAGRRLVAQGRSVLVVEAQARLGGRARTESVQGMPLDFGCGWLHSAKRNPLTRIAEAEGLAVDRRPSAWRRQLGDLGFPPDEQKAAWRAYQAFVERLHRNPPASDRAGDAMPADDPWRPFVDAFSSYVNGAELDRLSVADFLAYDDAASDDDWRLPGGYGAFIAGLGAQLPTALATTVRTVSHGSGVTLETDRGTIRARAAIVTVPTSVLARGAIGFEPAVDDHLQAAARLPLGLADKVFLALADPGAAPAESHLLGRPDRAETGSYYIRPLGRPVIECFLGGALARSLETRGPSAAVAFVTEELSRLLGADFVRGLSPIAVTRWAQEPFVGGSYSHALPRCADARAVLARPVSERLCFAGEACSTRDYSTAHGAWSSGLAAADWIERGLRH